MARFRGFVEFPGFLADETEPKGAGAHTLFRAMFGSALTRLVSLVLAAAVASPLSGAVWAFDCDCGEAQVGVVTARDGGAAVEACCGGCGERGASDKEDRAPADLPDDDCRDCGCPVCALHITTPGLVSTHSAFAPAAGPPEPGAAWDHLGAARGDLSDLMRPPRVLTA